MRSLNCAEAPTDNQILIECRHIFRTADEKHSEGAVIDYLSRVASNDFKCPDLCDSWACEFFNEHEIEITEDFFELKHG